MIANINLNVNPKAREKLTLFRVDILIYSLLMFINAGLLVCSCNIS